jgi:DNA-binding transcriptional regulator YhcF (GntR family)
MPSSPRSIRIDLSSQRPVHRQISDSLRALLVDGSLQPGDPLPPVRQLAIDLAVHFNTVAEAYRTLAQEGWVDLRRRRGALVIERTTPRKIPPESELKFARRLREFIAATQSEGLPTKTILRHLRLVAEGLE